MNMSSLVGCLLDSLSLMTLVEDARNVWVRTARGVTGM